MLGLTATKFSTNHSAQKYSANRNTQNHRNCATEILFIGSGPELVIDI